MLQRISLSLKNKRKQNYTMIKLPSPKERGVLSYEALAQYDEVVLILLTSIDTKGEVERTKTNHTCSKKYTA